MAKVALSSYQTKTNRKRLVNSYCSKFPLAGIKYMPGEGEVLLRSTNGRLLLVDTAVLATKTTRDTQGVAVMTQKRGQTLCGVEDYVEGTYAKPHRFRTKTLPAAGNFPAQEDLGEQLSL